MYELKEKIPSRNLDTGAEEKNLHFFVTLTKVSLLIFCYRLILRRIFVVDKPS